MAQPQVIHGAEARPEQKAGSPDRFAHSHGCSATAHSLRTALLTEPMKKFISTISVKMQLKFGKARIICKLQILLLQITNGGKKKTTKKGGGKKKTKKQHQ